MTTASTVSNSVRFWRFFTASTVSNIGTGVTSVALPLLAVSTLHASNFEVGLVVAATYVSWVVIGLPAGALVSRWPLRETQVVSDLVRGLALATIPVAALFDVLSLAQLVVVAAVVGFFSVIFDVANSTVVVSIVTPDALVKRNSQISASSSATQLAGPSLGGVLVQSIGASATILIDAVSYVVSAALLGSLPSQPAEEDAGPRPSMRDQIAEGVRFVWRHRIMRAATINVTIINLAAGALLVLTPLFLVRVLSAPPAVIGVLYASEGVGSLFGAAIAPRLDARLGSGRTLRMASAAAALLFLLMPLAPDSWIGYGLFALGNLGFAAFVTVLALMSRTHRQRVTPRPLLPRIMATVRFVSWGAAPIGGLLAAGAATAIGIRAAFWTAGVVALLSPVLLEAGPIRRQRELT